MTRDTRELQADPSFAKSRDERSWQRLEAVAGVAAAALRVGYSFLQDLDLVDWARQTLLEAIAVSRRAKEPVAPGFLHPRAAAAIGLAALLEQGEAGPGARERMLELSADHSREVREAAFAALRGLWQRDEELCWAAVDLAQALAVAKPKADGDPGDRDVLELFAAKMQLVVRRKPGAFARFGVTLPRCRHAADCVSLRSPRQTEPYSTHGFLRQPSSVSLPGLYVRGIVNACLRSTMVCWRGR